MSRPVRVAAAALAVAAAATLTLLPASAAAQDGPETDGPPAATWGLVPATAAGPDGRPRFDYKLDPGAELVDHVAISNHSTSEITLAVYASDAFTTVDGGFDLLAGATEPVGAGTWITLEQSTLTVPARSRVTVPFLVTVPADATPGDHAGGLVASLTSVGTDDDGGEVLVDHRLGARIYVRVTGDLAPGLTVERVEASYDGTWNPFAGGAVTATYTIRNTGNVRLAGQPEFAVAGWFGLGRRSVDGEPVTEILPGDAVTATVRAGGVAPLIRLTGTVTVDPSAVAGQQLDPPPPASTRTVIWAVPWSQGLLLLALLAAVAAWWWRRRRRQRRIEELMTAAREQGRKEALTGAENKQS